jgi:hypothetical protein
MSDKPQKLLVIEVHEARDLDCSDIAWYQKPETVRPFVVGVLCPHRVRSRLLL